jgi:hypothetical protein
MNRSLWQRAYDARPEARIVSGSKSRLKQVAVSGDTLTLIARLEALSASR